jgi:hydroxymethylbilane synthase
VTTAVRTLKLGTRGSALATTQAQTIADRVRGARVELVTITTDGDTDPRSLAQIGGTGVFAAALRTALLGGQVDIAVHCLKDLPVEPVPGLTVVAIPVREDPADVLVARDGLAFAELPAGARVGTGSPRRAAQLRAVRPDLDIVDVRGNIDTRIALVSSGRLDAVVLAHAGLARLGRLEDVTDAFAPELLLPAPGQGALAVECRADELADLLAPLDDAATRTAVTAERAVLAALGAGCSTPVGALAEPSSTGLRLRASVAGTITAEADGVDPLELGHRVAALLLERGAQPYLDHQHPPVP